MTFECYWKSMQSWVGMKLFVFVVHLLFWNLQKSSLVYRECGILQTVTHYGPQSADKAPYLPPGDMLSSSVGLNPGNLHQYPGDILESVVIHSVTNYLGLPFLDVKSA